MLENKEVSSFFFQRVPPQLELKLVSFKLKRECAVLENKEVALLLQECHLKFLNIALYRSRVY